MMMMMMMTMMMMMIAMAAKNELLLKTLGRLMVFTSFVVLSGCKIVIVSYLQIHARHTHICIYIYIYTHIYIYISYIHARALDIIGLPSFPSPGLPTGHLNYLGDHARARPSTS